MKAKETMAATIKLVGVYPVPGESRVHLIEVWINDVNGDFSFGSITQEQKGIDKSDWQVPYDEKILNENGTEIIVKDVLEPIIKLSLKGNVRATFFFHELDRSKPIVTPLGSVRINDFSKYPPRLRKIVYEFPY